MGSRLAPSGAPAKRTAAESTQESKRRAGLERRSPWYVDPRGARMAAGPPDAGYYGAPRAASVVVGAPSIPVAAPVKREWKQESASSAVDGQVAEESEEDFGDEPPRSVRSRVYVVGLTTFLTAKGPCHALRNLMLTAVAECMGRDSGLVKEDLVGDLESRHVGTAAPIGLSSLSLLGVG
ncbi:hypothetical protein B5M09_007441 [Aphanomyces astaci]|uniref:Uncharacterized protein n=1 Tax=Aphanomyces astaci TaxID=112090 RepID=A0A425DG80_APHAT|nr:hypothetical protein B5M09_007441 [Aphanomyces astaci]